MVEIATLENIKLPIPADPPNIQELTTNSIDGTGVFDQLMKVMKLHLLEEFNNQRITGKEYTTAYVNLTATTLDQAAKFLLNKQQVALINSEIALNRQRTVTELAQTDDTLIQGLGFNGDATVEGLVALLKTSETNKGNLIAEQILEVTAREAYIVQQTVTELVQTSDSIPLNMGYNTSVNVQGVMRGGIDRAVNEALLIEQKIVTELANTSDDLTGTHGLGTNILVEGVVIKSIEKASAEIQLLNQKSATELSQTHDTIPANIGIIGTSETVSGISGAQKSLFVAQTDGFARDAEQKLTKMVLDTWAVRRTTDEGTVVAGTGLEDSEIKKIVDKAKTGIGVTPGV